MEVLSFVIDGSTGGASCVFYKLVSLRVLVFCWLPRLQKILTRYKVKRKDVVLVNGFPLCLNDEETSSHLLLH